MVKVKRLDSFEDIDKERWRQILDSSAENHVFQTYEFASTWWKHFGDSNRRMELLLLTVEDSGSVVAIAPLMIKKIPYINKAIIQFIGTDICDYTDFIIKGENHQKYFPKIMEYLSGLGFLEIDLKYISESAKTVSDFNVTAREFYGNIYQADLCPYVDLRQDWQKITGCIKKKLRDEIRRNERRLIEKGELVFKACDSETEIMRVLKDYFVLHIKKWKHYGGRYSQFQYKRWRDFIAELSMAILGNGWLDLSYLELNKNIVACHFGFGYNNMLYYYMPAFDPALSAYSPAKILIMKMLERSYNKGLKEFDFLRGKEAYKFAWTDTARPVYNVRYYSKKRLLRYMGFLYSGLRDGYAANIKPALKKIGPIMRAWYGSRGDGN